MAALVEIVQPDVGRPFRAFSHSGATFPTYWHRHAEFELVCATTGGGELRVADLAERPPGPRVILLGPQIPHASGLRHGPPNAVTQPELKLLLAFPRAGDSLPE